MRDHQTWTESGAATNGRNRPSHTVRGYFADADAVENAVEGLVGESVPADELSVFVLDTTGRPIERVEVDDEAGVLKGALQGAAVGAALGFVVMMLALFGVLGDYFVEAVGGLSVLGTLRVVGASAAMASVIGGALGMGRWQGKPKLQDHDFREAGYVVAVENEELQDTARRVLRDAGAERIEG